MGARPWLQLCRSSGLAFLKYASNQASLPCMGWWGLITSSISQHDSYLYAIMSLVFGGSRSGLINAAEDTNHSDGDLLVTLNVKGILGEVPVWESASSPEAISSIGSHTMSPSSPSCNDGKGEVHSSASLCPLCLQFYASPCYGRSISHALLTNNQFTGYLEFTIGTKA